MSIGWGVMGGAALTILNWLMEKYRPYTSIMSCRCGAAALPGCFGVSTSRTACAPLNGSSTT